MKIKRTLGQEPMKPLPLAQENVTRLLSLDDGAPKPYCTCGQSGGFSFDAQLGVFVHVSDKSLCYKPSKAYYAAAVEAGIIVE